MTTLRRAADHHLLMEVIEREARQSRIIPKLLEDAINPANTGAGVQLRQASRQKAPLRLRLPREADSRRD